MHKRKYGYILLVLLVATGLGGRQYSATISNQERRFLIDGLKSSRALYIKTVENLSPAQLAFRSGPGGCSVGGYMQHLAAEENLFLKMAAAAARKPEEEQICSEKAVSFTSAECCSHARPVTDAAGTATGSLEDFKQNRQLLIRYARTTTGDIHRSRNDRPSGTMDTYQVLLLLPAHTLRCIRRIEAIMAHPDFPKDR